MPRRHRIPRVNVTPNTRQIVVSLGRSFDDQPAQGIELVLRLCKKTPDGVEHTMDWNPYDVCDGSAKFEIPCEFTDTGEFPRGLYRAKLMSGTCYIGCLEIVKAPGVYSAGVRADDDACANSNWCEPTCEVPEKKEECTTVDGCPGTCVTELEYSPTYLEDIEP